MWKPLRLLCYNYTEYPLIAAEMKSSLLDILTSKKRKVIHVGHATIDEA